MHSLISGKTKFLGLIADPVAQARTPDMANTLLEQRHQFGDFVLLPLQVSTQGIVPVVDALRQIQNFSGAVISMPHKTAIVELIDELTPEAALVGAVNVIRRNMDGRLIGTMLDGEGFVAGLQAAGYCVPGTHCVLAGAGGAASAIAFALAKHGCASLCIINRTSSRAEALAERVRSAFPRISVTTEATAAHFDIAINATSLGMRDCDELPFTSALIGRTRLVAECVITPEMTPLLELAAQQGKAIHTGVPMLAAQMELMLEFMGAAQVSRPHP